MKKVVKWIINTFFNIFKVQENKIIFESGRGLIDGNPKAIFFYMKENNVNDYKCVWLVDKKTDVSMLEQNEYFYYHTLKALYHQATAKYWIRSESLGSILNKKKNQIYIQTWHGHGALKMMGYDVTKETNKPPLDHVKEWDYLLSTDDVDKSMMLTSTGYNKNIFMLGAPCTDIILNNAQNKTFIKIVKQKLNIPLTKKVILYAPTFREADLAREKVQVKIEKLKELKELKEYVVLLRLHPLIRNKIDKSLFTGNIINACNYPDVSEILPITDILISDYSSIVYEFAILNRPIIFYAYDLNFYLKERGFYIPYDDTLPGPIVKNDKELYNLIVNINKLDDEYKEKLINFNEKYNKLNDGHATENFVKLLKNNFFK